MHNSLENDLHVQPGKLRRRNLYAVHRHQRIVDVFIITIKPSFILSILRADQGEPNPQREAEGTEGEGEGGRARRRHMNKEHARSEQAKSYAEERAARRTGPTTKLHPTCASAKGTSMTATPSRRDALTGSQLSRA
jgi:hypothetical protein